MDQKWASKIVYQSDKINQQKLQMYTKGVSSKMEPTYKRNKYGINLLLQYYHTMAASPGI